MTTAIEQLIKMHDPRCMSIESLNVGRGQGILSKEQIVGAFATAQHQHAVGFDLLMANTGTIARPNNGSAPRLQIG